MISKLHSREYNDEAKRFIDAHKKLKNEIMLEKLQAVNGFVYIIKDASVTKIGGLDIPEPSLKRPNTGKIISVGNLVQDKNIKKGRTALFNKQAGGEIEMFDTEITVVNGNDQIHGVII